MKLTIAATVLVLATSTTAIPILAELLGTVGGLLGSPKLPNQTGSVITLPITGGAGYAKPNSCVCKSTGTFCGYRAYTGKKEKRPLVAAEGGACDPLTVYTCNQVEEFGSGGACLLCLPSMTFGREQVGKDVCTIRLANEAA